MATGCVRSTMFYGLRVEVPKYSSEIGSVLHPKCHEGRMQVVLMGPVIEDFKFSASPELLNASLLPLVPKTVNLPVYSFDMVPSPSAMLEADYRRTGPNYIVPRRINPLG